MIAPLQTKDVSCCQPLQCQAPSPTPQKQGGRSATDLLQSYIDRFDRFGNEGDSAPVQPGQISTTKDCKWTPSPSLGIDGQEKAQPRPHPTDQDDDRDTFELLCGRSNNSRECTAGSQKAAPSCEPPPPVSLRARRILQDLDRQLGHVQPCYSAPDKLDLRTMWPSMHEHLDRRWRQQLRARYEAQQSEKAALAARDAACQGSRAGMYGRADAARAWLRPARAAASLKAQAAMSADRADDKEEEGANEGENISSVEDEDGDKAEAETGSDSDVDGGGGGGNGGVCGATSGSPVQAARSENEGEQLEASGQRWGSDSGVGLSCLGGGPGEVPQPVAAKQPRSTADNSSSVDHEDSDSAGDRCSFEERMRSYRCVLEAHELSEQLRQRLQVACAAGGPPRVLSTDQKGRIRERLASLQHPRLLAAASAEPGAARLRSEQQQQQQQEQQEQQERITTERLARLMSSARVLLPDGEGKAPPARPTYGQLLLCGGGGSRTAEAAGGRRQSADESS